MMPLARMFNSWYHRTLKARGPFLGSLLFATVGTVGAFTVLNQQQPHPCGSSSSSNVKHYYQENQRIDNAFYKTLRSLKSKSPIQTMFMPSTVLCATLEREYQEVQESAGEEEVSASSISNSSSSGTIESKLGAYDDPTTYYYEKMEHPTRNQAESHAIFGTLRGDKLIERYNHYRRVSTVENSHSIPLNSMEEIMVADIRIGKNLNGHTGIVHGGIISLLLDDSLGWGCEAMALRMGKNFGDDDFPVAVTANLNINYRAPLPEETDSVIRVYYDKAEGRKIFLTARMESYDGSILYSEATVLYITIPLERLKQAQVQPDAQ